MPNKKDNKPARPDSSESPQQDQKPIPDTVKGRIVLWDEDGSSAPAFGNVSNRTRKDHDETVKSPKQKDKQTWNPQKQTDSSNERKLRLNRVSRDVRRWHLTGSSPDTKSSRSAEPIRIYMDWAGGLEGGTEDTVSDNVVHNVVYF